MGLASLVWRRRLSPVSSDTGESEHPLDVPSHGDEAPLAFDLIEAAQRELPEPHDRLDDAEHRLGELLTQGVEALALGCCQAVAHGLERRWIVRRRRRGGEALAPGWMMMLTPDGDQRRDPGLGA